MGALEKPGAVAKYLEALEPQELFDLATRQLRLLNADDPWAQRVDCLKEVTASRPAEVAPCEHSPETLENSRELLSFLRGGPSRGDEGSRPRDSGHAPMPVGSARGSESPARPSGVGAAGA